MVTSGYVVVEADVIRVTSRVVTVRPTTGPQQGKDTVLPRSGFEDPYIVDVGDDEIVVAEWLARGAELVAMAGSEGQVTL